MWRRSCLKPVIILGVARPRSPGLWRALDLTSRGGASKTRSSRSATHRASHETSFLCPWLFRTADARASNFIINKRPSVTLALDLPSLRGPITGERGVSSVTEESRRALALEIEQSSSPSRPNSPSGLSLSTRGGGAIGVGRRDKRCWWRLPRSFDHTIARPFDRSTVRPTVRSIDQGGGGGIASAFVLSTSWASTSTK